MAIHHLNAKVKLLAGPHAGAIGQVVRYGPLNEDPVHVVHISAPLVDPEALKFGISERPANGKGLDVHHPVEVELPGSALELA